MLVLTAALYDVRNVYKHSIYPFQLVLTTSVRLHNGLKSFKSESGNENE